MIQFGTIFDIFGNDINKGIMKWEPPQSSKSQNSGCSSTFSQMSQYYANIKSANNSATQYVNARQSIIDTAWKGTVLGILEVSKLRHKLYELDNGDVVFVPTESREYEFFVKIEGGKKDSIFRIRPAVRDCSAPDLLKEYGTRIGCCSELYIESLDSENEIPPHNKLTWIPQSTVKFELCNLRASLGDNTYRFLINDREVVSLFDDRQEAYMCTDCSILEYFFTETKYFHDYFTQEFQKYLNKVERKHGSEATKQTTVTNAVCTGQRKTTDNFTVVGLKLRQQDGTWQFAPNILYKNNEIIVDKGIPMQPNPTSDMADREVLLVCGEDMIGKKFYQLLIIGGEIVAQKQIH